MNPIFLSPMIAANRCRPVLAFRGSKIVAKTTPIISFKFTSFDAKKLAPQVKIADEYRKWFRESLFVVSSRMSEELTDPEDPSQPDDQGGDAPAVELEPAERIKRLEAVLFLARQPLTSRKISQLAGLEDGTQARTIIRELNETYDQQGQAFHIKRVAGGYQLLTRPQFSKWIRRLDHVPGTSRLSTPALETLTVVAYRQPIIKAEIEAIRGVSCGEMLRQLLEKGLVKIAGRSPELGRPFLYGTSKRFLTSYGLNTLNDLPNARELTGEGLPEQNIEPENHLGLSPTDEGTNSSEASTTDPSATTLLNTPPKEIQS